MLGRRSSLSMQAAYKYKVLLKFASIWIYDYILGGKYGDSIPAEIHESSAKRFTKALANEADKRFDLVIF